MRECFVITTYCDTKEKIDRLNQTIDNLKQFNIDIMIHAHEHPLNFEIQKKVDYYFFDKNNPVLKERWNVFWFFIDNYKLEIKVYDYTYTVLKSWINSIKILSDYNYDKIHVIMYDANITPELFNLSKIYNNKSIFIQSLNTTKNYITATYFCLNKNTFDFFVENITLEKFLNFKTGDKFLPIIEEFIPAFTIDDRFYQIPNTDYDTVELSKYDIVADSRFDMNKKLKLQDNKMFIGEFNNSLHILFFDVEQSIKVIINDNTEIEINSNYLLDLKQSFEYIKNLKIKIDNVYVNDEFINQFYKLECKIYTQ